MAILISRKLLLRATLPQGYGFAGVLGLPPEGGPLEAFSPLPLWRARALCLPSSWGQTPGAWGRPGWTYRYCPTYAPPMAGACGKPDQKAVVRARRQRAHLTGRELLAWLRSRGQWAELVD